ncbi:cilia- and flagella-associated protein 68 isoform X3 [Mus musculus]|uniref:cilia- and flagella-associated protein 68 isoform X3 n=1 Tax=Mus musculus TaxID=10090 RepID=UPI0016748288|nr:uncharacterized protein CFAP68 isoform X3 [Mus musculus]
MNWKWPACCQMTNAHSRRGNSNRMGDKTLSVILETHTMAALFMLMVMEKCGQTGMTCPSFYSTDGDAPLMRTPIRTVPCLDMPSKQHMMQTTAGRSHNQHIDLNESLTGFLDISLSWILLTTNAQRSQLI